MAPRPETRREWVTLGAAVRLQQIDREAKKILAAFPNLRRNLKGDALDGLPAARRRKVSAAARRAISERMRRFWARRKKDASKG